MKLTIYTANCCGKKNNTIYPNKCIIDNEEDFCAAIAYDHVCAQYRKSHRSIEDFISADCSPFDNDNDHSDDPADWIYPEDYEEMLPDVPYIVVPSRHNMKPKDGKSARPRNHIYFPHDLITDSDEYKALKEAVIAKFPFFDDNAMDAARFVFGHPTDEIIWHEGDLTIDCIVKPQKTKKAPQPEKGIPQGQRNSTMSRFAGRIVKRYGATDRAYDIFIEESKKCNPPLDDEELQVIWGSACKFAKKVQSQEGYVPPEEYEFHGESLKPSDYSDIGQAKVISREYGDELRFTVATDYLRYDGSSWVESKQKAVGAVEEFLDLQLEDARDEVRNALAALVTSGVDEGEAKNGGKKFAASLEGEQMELYEKYLLAVAYKAFVMKRRDMKYIVSAMQAAKPMLEMSPSDLDRDGFLLNTPDGTYDLRKGMDGKQPHSAEDFITKMTAFSPDDDGKDEWLAAVDLIFQSDSELIDYVQQTAGLCAIGNVYREEMAISYGVGSNGKSTFWNSVAGALGTYSGNISADTLTVGCKRNVKPELAEAKGKRLLIAAELEEGMRLNTSTVKQLCSTDEIFAEKKYKDPFSFKPSHTLVLYTNHLPKVGAMDDGIWRRLIVIPFNAKITGRSDIKNYSEYLLATSGPYIIKWIIEGAKKAIDNGFQLKKPKVVQDAINKYKSDNDWLSHFFNECCELDPGLEEKSGEVYQAYRAYCARVGDFTRSTTEFYNALDARGIRRRRTAKSNMLVGLKLVNTEDF